MLSGENQEHFYLCAYYSVFLTISSSWGAYSKVPKGRETTDGGITPGSSATTKEAPTGRQSFNMLFTKQLDVLPPLWGFRFVDVPVPGVLPFGQAQADNTPSVAFRAFGAFPWTTIIINLRALLVFWRGFNVYFLRPL